ncbi:hypothetical protein ACQ4M3_06435 [Leptolyngbya sp. AN03gr2]|uniref:hypothetical protein n=1 Tax=unclassified Leptolyngbya TaxID=2650499 RepID=UPI003D31A7E9
MKSLELDELPFLRSICWQGETPSIDPLNDAEIIQLYERNWRYRGVIADLSETEKEIVYQLAIEHHSWLVNEL